MATSPSESGSSQTDALPYELLAYLTDQLAADLNDAAETFAEQNDTEHLALFNRVASTANELQDHFAADQPPAEPAVDPLHTTIDRVTELLYELQLELISTTHQPGNDDTPDLTAVRPHAVTALGHATLLRRIINQFRAHNRPDHDPCLLSHHPRTDAADGLRISDSNGHAVTIPPGAIGPLRTQLAVADDEF